MKNTHDTECLESGARFRKKEHGKEDFPMDKREDVLSLTLLRQV